MRIFACSVCKMMVFFENVRCTTCSHPLAYLPDHRIMSALERVADAPSELYTALAPVAKGARYRLCANSVEHGVCNWAVPEASSDPLCRACTFNDTIPNLSKPASLEAWHTIEMAKRRLFYTLDGLGLPLVPKSAQPEGLAFAFKADDAGEKVMTGHADGLITINIAEAHSPFREQIRLQLHETYRTLLGHFRHEIGHYYWSRLIDGTPLLESFRAKFGDESLDYSAAVKRHYDEGPPPDWATHFVSAYASMHPWEDWAETWAHYLHMVDTLDTSRSYGLALRPAPVGGTPAPQLVARKLDFDDFDDLITAWVPLTLALNSLNRSMGLPDLYPFVLSAEAIAKLRFVHDVVDHAK